MVAVNHQLSSQPLAGLLIEGSVDPAMAAAAAALAQGRPCEELLDDVLQTALSLCGLEAAGASWSHALLSVGAVASLLTRYGPDVAAPAVVGVAGFVAHARPTRARTVPAGPGSWPGTPQWLDLIRAGDLVAAVRGFRAVPAA
ncbi:MAG: hypothetical protein KDA24_18960, partial [Deltaproteobacteria bacterium]|nr:hypothetical protein [Deltaproteobacteria bacterium]